MSVHHHRKSARISIYPPPHSPSNITKMGLKCLSSKMAESIHSAIYNIRYPLPSLIATIYTMEIPQRTLNESTSTSHAFYMSTCPSFPSYTSTSTKPYPSHLNTFPQEHRMDGWYGYLAVRRRADGKLSEEGR